MHLQSLTNGMLAAAQLCIVGSRCCRYHPRARPALYQAEQTTPLILAQDNAFTLHPSLPWWLHHHIQVNIIPGAVNFTVDMRSRRDDFRDGMRATLTSKVAELCARRGVDCSVEVLHSAAAVRRLLGLLC
jgi:acetylornithine deacetylase/succinyl-diaminopimelate desuccinylase-like protein